MHVRMHNYSCIYDYMIVVMFITVIVIIVELSEVLWNMILSPLNLDIGDSFSIVLSSVYLFFSFAVWAGKFNLCGTTNLISLSFIQYLLLLFSL